MRSLEIPGARQFTSHFHRRVLEDLDPQRRLKRPKILLRSPPLPHVLQPTVSMVNKFCGFGSHVARPVRRRAKTNVLFVVHNSPTQDSDSVNTTIAAHPKDPEECAVRCL